jgi:hypothetical protein
VLTVATKRVPLPLPLLERVHIHTHSLTTNAPTLRLPCTPPQVLEDRGEMGSRHGRATFSVLLFQVGAWRGVPHLLAAPRPRVSWRLIAPPEGGGAAQPSASLRCQCRRRFFTRHR